MTEQDQQELLERLNTSSTPERVLAAQALGVMNNTSAISALVEHLADEDPEVADACANSLLRMGGRSAASRLVNMLNVQQVALRNRAKDLLWVLGVEVPDQILGLLREAEDNLRLHAAELLGAIPGTQSSKALIEALNDPNPNVRAAAAHSLGRKAEVVAVPGLLEKLDDDEWVLFAVIEALAAIGDPQCVEPLIKAMDGASDLIKTQIVEALGLFTDSRIITPLLEVLPKSEDFLFSQILITLLEISDADHLFRQLDQGLQDKILPTLTEALHNPSERVKQGTLRCLGLLGDVSSVEPILELARSPQNLIFMTHMVEALVNIGSVPPLLAAAQDGSELLSLVAVDALGRLGGDLAVEALSRALGHKFASVRLKAAMHLGKLESASAQSALVKALDDPDPTVQLAVVRSLRDIAGPEAVESLNELLEHPSAEIRRNALETLASIGGPRVREIFEQGLISTRLKRRVLCIKGLARAAAEGVDAELLTLLNDPEPEIRISAVRSLFERDATKHWDRLAELIEDPDPMVRMGLVSLVQRERIKVGLEVLIRGLADELEEIKLESAKGLKYIGDENAVDPLQELLRRDDPKLKAAAAQALGAIGDPRSAGPLMNLLMDSDPVVRSTAISALQSMDGGWG